MFPRQTIPADGVPPALWRVHTNPDGIDLLDFLVVRANEFPATLGRNHPATVIYATLDQRIAGIKIILRLHINDKADFFPGTRDNSTETNVIGDGPLMH